MKESQKVVILVSLVAFLLTITFAPWAVGHRDWQTTVYRPIWSPPDRSKLIVPALLIEWAAIGVVCGVVLFLFKEKNL